ncbi:MAG: TlpA family protein disulfide reductase [Gemmatales bacterium]|nr:TlpA family protein disulfide reductase [Gemmatales bacterium]MDW8385853.1 TlpA disulfide reductase family protein [Gemmatales bacterium]
MLTTLMLVGSLAAAAQPGERAEWILTPRLVRGQELVYRGTAAEVNLGRGVHFSKSYHIDIRSLVLDAKGDSLELAIQTRVAQQQPTEADRADGTSSGSVRLEVVEVEGTGRIVWPASSPAWFEPNGPCVLEAGFLLEVPRTAVTIGQTWTIEQARQPPLTVKVLGPESLGNLSCVKLQLEQQSPEWNNPRADKAGWRRTETIWITPRLGVAQRIVRTVEVREPAHRDPTYRLSTQFDLESSLRYEGQFLEDRRREILAIRQFEESIRSLLPRAAQNSAALKQLASRVEQFAEKHPATPYREALERVKRFALDASENRLPPAVVGPQPASRFAIGKAAPDFLVHDVKTGEAVSLRKCQGRAVLMVFFLPGAESCRLFFRFVQDLADRHGDKELVVLGFAMSDDVAKTTETIERMQVRFPVCPGKSLKNSYEVEATPRFVVVDAEGIVRAAFTGWGPEIPPALAEALRKSLPTVRVSAP